MRYVSIDLETTGLDPETCDVLEFAAVVDDLKVQKPLKELSVFHRYIYQPLYRGEPYALGMHKEIFDKIAKWQAGKDRSIQICDQTTLFEEFYFFLRDHYLYDDKSFCHGRPIKVLAAGKNFATFDSRFIAKMHQPDAYPVEFNHRTLDPAMLYMTLEDKGPPSMADCMKRAKIKGEVAHTATEDALTVIELLRKKFPLKP